MNGALRKRKKLNRAQRYVAHDPRNAPPDVNSLHSEACFTGNETKHVMCHIVM